jgi:hypothetical protein
MKRRRQRQRKHRRGLLVAIVLVLLAASAGAAFTAALGVGASEAGDGSGAVSKPNVTSMQFEYDVNTPTKIAHVYLSFSSAVTQAQAKLTGGSWSSACTGSGTGPWTCAWSGGTPVPTSGSTLRVVATT